MAVHRTQIGAIGVTIVEEFVLPTSVRWMFPESEAPFDILERARPWLAPHYINERGHLLQAIQMFVIEDAGVTIGVDTGVGNDKQRGSGIPDFHMRSGPFLDELTAAGFPPERFDLMVSTHMHSDHVGWNTRLVEERWLPTFPNARYLFVEPEWTHWSAEAGRNEGTRTLVEDSLRPVLDAGRVDLVAPDHRLTERTVLEPSFGHSPGHVTVRVASEGAELAIIGDMMHSPIQCAAPAERPTFDRDAVPARETRLAFLEATAGTDVLVMGSHWHYPPGRIRQAGDGFRLEAS